MDLLKYLNPKNWPLFEERSDGYFFLRVWFFVLMAAFFIGTFTLSPVNFSAVLIAGTFAALLVYSGIKAASSFAGSLYTGSHGRDDKAIIKGMYKHADILEYAKQHSLAETAYRDLLAAYPKELDARFLLGKLLYRELDDAKGALNELRFLNRTIKEKKIQYNNQETLDELLLAIREGIREEKEEKLQGKDPV